MLAARVRQLGRHVELLIVRDAGHVFNFKNGPQASCAWGATPTWFDT